MDLNLLSMTLNIITPTSDISSIITSCNYSYHYVSLFNGFVDKFNKLNKDCWINMLKATSPIDAISKALVIVKLERMFLFYNYDNP
jgi:hypothetical protein